MNSYEMEFEIKERRQKMAEEFKGIHLMKLNRAGKPSWRKKWVLRLADLMIDLGTTLKRITELAAAARTAPAVDISG